MEKSDIELLREFAKSTGRTIEAKELLYPRTGIRTTQKYKRMVSIPNNSERSNFFIWFNDPYSTIGRTTIFSGAFIPLPSKIASTLKIRKRYAPDRLNPFAKSKDNKTGNSFFDSKVVISGTLDTGAKRILSSSKVQKQLLKALEIESHFQIAINHFNVDFIPELNDKSSISIINDQEWDVDHAHIEKVFEIMEKIRAIVD